MDLQYIDRDLSWLDFNERVLNEALRTDLPLLERFKFLSIVSSNFDEFFMVRAAAIKRAMKQQSNNELFDPAGNAAQLLQAIRHKAHTIIQKQYEILNNEVLPALAKNGLEYAAPDSWTDLEREYLSLFFMDEIFSALTPLRFDENAATPIGGQAIYAAFLLRPRSDAEAAGRPFSELPEGEPSCMSLVQLPRILRRIVFLPNKARAMQTMPNENETTARWALLDDIVMSFGEILFAGFAVQEKLLFKINRDADFSVDENRDEDFIEAMEEVVINRESSHAVRMVHTKIISGKSKTLRNKLAEYLNLKNADIYEVSNMLDLGSLIELSDIQLVETLKTKPVKIYHHPDMADFVNDDRSIWDRISEHDILLHLPYHSFDPVIRFFADAADDPNVIAIKTTLYRTSGNSPIIKALEKAAHKGKQVTVIVELKARFDEERNISWAKDLEKFGAIVVYGLANLKVHAKTAIVLRREDGRVRRYVHFSTGNYNDKTAKIYSDLSLFTANEDFAFDSGLFFNMLTGYSSVMRTRKFIVAPLQLKQKLIELIEREQKNSSPEYPGSIKAKLNALVDVDVINALYAASNAGVVINLNVRSICSLVPGVKGLSENIRVVSLIDHFLEHARIISFGNSGSQELYLSSADWMPRNLERRVEIMAPILDSAIKKQVNDMLDAYFLDNCQTYLLTNNKTWQRRQAALGETPFRAQQRFASCARALANETKKNSDEFIVRRT